LAEENKEFSNLIQCVPGMIGIVWTQARPSDAWGLVLSDVIVAGIFRSAELFWPTSLNIPDRDTDRRMQSFWDYARVAWVNREKGYLCDPVFHRQN
jgi:hypothetical protein